MENIEEIFTGWQAKVESQFVNAANCYKPNGKIYIFSNFRNFSNFKLQKYANYVINCQVCKKKILTCQWASQDKKSAEVQKLIVDISSTAVQSHLVQNYNQ